MRNTFLVPLRRLVAGAVAALTVAAGLTAAAEPATAVPATSVLPTAPAPPPGKGTVGWDTYRHLDRVSGLTTGTATKQFSSFDRDGGNDDFWNNPSQCQRLLGNQCVIAEHSGAGEVDAIWFTVNDGDVTDVGNITVTLDGKQVLHGKLQDIVNGKQGAPFAYPLVGNADQSSGGVYIAVPMPFARSMRISTDSSNFYYHVTYRTFADANGVATFNPADKASDVLATLKASGTRDPKPAVPGARTTNTPLNLPPGGTVPLAATNGPGQITAVQLKLPQIPYVRSATVRDDGRAFGRGGSSSFVVKIDPRNQGVRLTRRIDSMIGNQVADVAVDGKIVARWAPNPRTPTGVWTNESVDLPAAATAGKSKITVTNTFVSSDLDFNEFSYFVDSLVGGKPVRTDTVDVANPASEAAHQYRITAPTFEGVRTNTYPLNPDQLAKLATARSLLTGLRLRMSFDATTTVDSPIGEFFGTGSSQQNVKSLMFGVDPQTGTYIAWWPMPYQQSAQVTLYNGSTQSVTGSAAVTAASDPGAGAALATGRTGYFRTSSHAGPTVQDKDWTYLTATGTGRYVGNTVDMKGPDTRRYLEGDERVYPDGIRSPQVHGTGTEDYYQSGWYFNRDTYSGPLHGNPTHQTSVSGCDPASDCTTAYRLWLAEAVPFASSLDFTIEHGDVDNVAADYSSTAFWYGRAAVTTRQTDALTVGDPASENAHGYGSPMLRRPYTLSNTFEGMDGPQSVVAAKVRSAVAPVTFSMKIDPRSAGAVLTRMSDQALGYQGVRVNVNGTRLPDWTQPLGNPYHRWLDDIYQLPASVTAGKSRLTVTLTPIPGSPPWTAAGYRVASVLPSGVS